MLESCSPGCWECSPRSWRGLRPLLSGKLEAGGFQVQEDVCGRWKTGSWKVWRCRPVLEDTGVWVKTLRASGRGACSEGATLPGEPCLLFRHLSLSKRGPSKSPGGVTPRKPWGPNLVCGTSCWESLGSWIRPCCGSVSFGWRQITAFWFRENKLSCSLCKVTLGM